MKISNQLQDQPNTKIISEKRKFKELLDAEIIANNILEKENEKLEKKNERLQKQLGNLVSLLKG